MAALRRLPKGFTSKPDVYTRWYIGFSCATLRILSPDFPCLTRLPLPDFVWATDLACAFGSTLHSWSTVHPKRQSPEHLRKRQHSRIRRRREGDRTSLFRFRWNWLQLNDSQSQPPFQVHPYLSMSNNLTLQTSAQVLLQFCRARHDSRDAKMAQGFQEHVSPRETAHIRILRSAKRYSERQTCNPNMSVPHGRQPMSPSTNLTAISSYLRQYSSTSTSSPDLSGRDMRLIYDPVTRSNLNLPGRRAPHTPCGAPRRCACSVPDAVSTQASQDLLRFA